MKKRIYSIGMILGLLLLAALTPMCTDGAPEDFDMCQSDEDCVTGFYCSDEGLCLPRVDGDIDGDIDIVDGDGDESPHQCLTSDDCPGCSLCTTIEGINTCIGIGDYECITDADCTESDFCSAFKVTEPQCGGTCQPGQDADYVLHEWGVNMVTPGGSEISGGPARFWGAVPAKPVLYVYADEPLTFDLGVRFSSGTVTETWPELPNARVIEWKDIEVSQGECNLTPTPQPDQSSMEPEDKEVYQVPQWRVDDADCLTVGDTISDLLFYTGRLDGHIPPVQLSMERKLSSQGEVITFTATNTLEEAIGPTLLVYRDTFGECVDPSLCPVSIADLAFAVIEGIDPGETINTTVPVMHLTSADEYQSIEIPPDVDQMRQRLRTMLRDAGLYGDEIDVFMNTWQDMFFGIYASDVYYFLPDYSTGAFGMYLWPDAYTEAQLTLRPEPPPTELKRAIVQFERIAVPQPQTGDIVGEVTLVENDGMGEAPVYTGPAAGALVQAWRPGAAEPSASATTDDDGLYSMTLPVGIYSVTAERNEWESGDRVDNVTVLANQQTEVNLTIYSEAMVDKPNLYLYPTETTDVSVRVDLHYGCEITQSIPEYGDGWDVTVTPEGIIDGEYTYLFYEAEIPRFYPMVEGWAVAKENLATFFGDTLGAYGFTEAETADFVDYWPQHLAPAAWYGIYPMVEARFIDPLASLDIQPVPDSLFRLWLIIEPVDEEPGLLPPVIVPMERSGFAAVEWGVIQE